MMHPLPLKIFIFVFVLSSGCSISTKDKPVIGYDLYNVQRRITVRGQSTVEPWEKTTSSLFIGPSSITLSDELGHETLDFSREPEVRHDSIGNTQTIFFVDIDIKGGPFVLTIPDSVKPNHPGGLFTMTGPMIDVIFELRPLKQRAMPRPTLHDF